MNDTQEAFTDLRLGRWSFSRAKHDPGLCCHIGRVGEHRNVIAHISVGLPVWWKPNAHRKHYNGITEFGAGWLLLAVQVASRPRNHHPPSPGNASGPDGLRDDPAPERKERT